MKLHATNQVTTMNPFANLLRRCALLLALLLAAPTLALAAEQKTFATPEAAVDALLAALKANDEAALIALFGDQHKNLVVSGDPANDAARRAETVKLLETYRTLDDSAPDRRILLLGALAWPSPIPLVKQSGSWRFATEQGAEELINRRIGGNERHAIHALRASVDAQRVFASRDRNGDGVLEYAQRLGSTPGKKDGLYWPADTAKGEEESPLGPLIAESSTQTGRKQGSPYFGYLFHMLQRQGPAAPGGAYSYVINGRMIAGFAMVAFPAAYGDSGVMTFVVSHNGKVYEKDLGKDSLRIASAMTSFDPGASAGWKEVTP